MAPRGSEADEAVSAWACPASQRTYRGNYLDLHNSLTELGCEWAGRVLEEGGTIVAENPVDCGLRQSPYFRWAARLHGSLWITPAIRALRDAATTAGLDVV